MSLRNIAIYCCFCFMSTTVFGQTENVINSILEESLIQYFNWQDSICKNMKIDSERFVCTKGFPLNYDYNKCDLFIFHDGSYHAVKRLKKKKDKGIFSAYVFFNFKNDLFIVSVVNRYVMYRNKKNCEISYSDSMHFSYKFDDVSCRWICVKQELTGL